MLTEVKMLFSSICLGCRFKILYFRLLPSVDSVTNVEEQAAVGIQQIDIHNAGLGEVMELAVKPLKVLIVVRQRLGG